MDSQKVTLSDTNLTHLVNWNKYPEYNIHPLNKEYNLKFEDLFYVPFLYPIDNKT